MGVISFLRGESHLQKVDKRIATGESFRWPMGGDVQDESGYEDCDWDDTSLPDLPDVDSDWGAAVIWNK